MFLLVPAHPGSPGQRAVKRLLLLVVLLLLLLYPFINEILGTPPLIVSTTESLVWRVRVCMYRPRHTGPHMSADSVAAASVGRQCGAVSLGL